ncbi:MAG TPA: GH3 auxin-responsive promoter family protein [Saprospiraceae bacterium]|nr:GH3 auxin-responsive promoter family protein [Saprospiraceae bacterium]
MPIVGNIIKRGISLGERLEDRFQAQPPIHYQQRTLRRLLRKAQQTAFGQYYDFKDILKSEDMIGSFQQNIPVYDYDTMYEKWWHMSLNQVENVSWKGKIKYFAKSSGTSGAPSKHIPVSEDMTRAMRRAGLKMFLALSNFDVSPDLFTKGMMMLGGTSDLEDQGGFFAGDLSGINANKPPFWLRPYYKPGKEIARISSWDERLAEIVKQAPDWDIGYLVGIPSWLQLMMERIIEVHELETIHDIWPNLQVCVHGGIHFEPLRKSFESLMAHPLIYMDSYLASEGFIAYQDRPETRAMRLLLGNGIFFEFIPFNDENFDASGKPKPEARSLSIDQVELGVNYALIITTCSGAWRYMIGDTVEFTDLDRSEIIITGRTKHYLSVCGEHLSVDNMNRGVQEVERQLGVAIREYTVAPVEIDRFHAHKWYLGVDKDLSAEAARQILDQHLRVVNEDYGIERDAMLRPPIVEVIPLPLFYAWQREQDKLGGQNKFPRVMQQEKFQVWEQFVQQNR